MKHLPLLFLVLSACATNRFAYNEAESCPGPQMSKDQMDSGAVRCRAMCSSYARDFASYDTDCRCRCAPAHGGYRPTKRTWTNET